MEYPSLVSPLALNSLALDVFVLHVRQGHETLLEFGFCGGAELALRDHSRRVSEQYGGRDGVLPPAFYSDILLLWLLLHSEIAYLVWSDLSRLWDVRSNPCKGCLPMILIEIL